MKDITQEELDRQIKQHQSWLATLVRTHEAPTFIDEGVKVGHIEVGSTMPVNFKGADLREGEPPSK